jgi:hypothetical protein
MDDIFAGSTLTFVAASGESDRDGIPGVSVPREEQLTLRTDAGLFTTSLLRSDLDIAASKWASNGLTFQESLFSRRRLVFTSSQMYFQCDSFHCHESISLPLQYAGDFNVGRFFPSGAASQLCAGNIHKQISEYIPRAFASMLSEAYYTATRNLTSVWTTFLDCRCTTHKNLGRCIWPAKRIG